MKRPASAVKAAPIPVDVAPLLGVYVGRCGCHYRAHWQHGALWLARTRPGQAEEEPFRQEADELRRMRYWQSLVPVEAVVPAPAPVALAPPAPEPVPEPTPEPAPGYAYAFTLDEQPGAERTRELERLLGLGCFTPAECAKARATWQQADFDRQCRVLIALIRETLQRGTHPASGPPPLQCRPDWWPEYLTT